MQCAWWKAQYSNVTSPMRCSTCKLSNVRGKYGCPLSDEPFMMLSDYIVNGRREIIYRTPIAGGFFDFISKENAIAAQKSDKRALL